MDTINKKDFQNTNGINSNAPVITLDGPTATGKGTVGLLLAKKLNWN